MAKLGVCLSLCNWQPLPLTGLWTRAGANLSAQCWDKLLAGRKRFQAGDLEGPGGKPGSAKTTFSSWAGLGGQWGPPLHSVPLSEIEIEYGPQESLWGYCLCFPASKADENRQDKGWGSLPAMPLFTSHHACHRPEWVATECLVFLCDTVDNLFLLRLL